MNTIGPESHVTDDDIDRLGRRELTPSELVQVTDHMAACVDCQQRLARRRGVEAAQIALDDALGESADHVPESDVHAFVDGRLDASSRRDIAGHLEHCAACAEEVRDLQHFAAADRSSTRFRPVQWYGGLAVAAALILVVVIFGLLRTKTTPQVASIEEVPGVSVDAQGNIKRVDGLTDAEMAKVRDALASRRLSFPGTVQDLIGTRGTLLGDAHAAGFALAAPVSTGVLTERPSLQWTPLSDASTYIVTIQDEATGETLNSPTLHDHTWSPDAPLTRGHTYLWQVAASFNGIETVAPKPPDPPAKFFVVGAEDASRLAKIPASHLVRGILYANAGLVDDAERELAAVAAQNPNSDVVSRLLTQLREFRGPRRSQQ
jgi:Putative zinc-finger